MSLNTERNRVPFIENNIETNYERKKKRKENTISDKQ